MTLQEYQKLAQRTSNTSMDDKFEHGHFGLIGEAGEVVDVCKKTRFMGMPEELASEKYLDECGDFCWYVAECCTGLDIRMGSTFEDALCVYLARNDPPKKNSDPLLLMYSVTCIDDFNILHFAYMLSIVVKILTAHGHTLDECLEHNIEKLRRRYPKGFDARRSNERYEEV